MSCDVKQLVELMRKCEADTREIIGGGAANMLAHWQRHEADKDRLVKFIHDRIHSSKKANGWKLHQSGRLSLEKIVAVHCPDLFTSGDVRVAKATLNLP